MSKQNYQINLGNLDYMASLRACLCEHKGWGTVPLFICFYCMLAGESRISSNMTISASYRTQKLQFNVPRTYLCFIIRNKIGLHLYLLPLTNIGLFKWNHLAVTSFSHHFHFLTIVLFT